MVRWFILVLTALFTTGYLALAEFTPAHQQIVNSPYATVTKKV